MEKWRSVPGFPFYEASDAGRVRSLGKPYHTAKVLTPQKRTSPNRKPYFGVSLRLNGKTYNRYVHRLVLQTFVGEAPPAHEAAHLDGDWKNNALKNLKWVTHEENCAHRTPHGTQTIGERHPMAKLNDERVLAIRALADQTQKRLAADYGVSQATICMIRQRKTWRHLP